METEREDRIRVCPCTLAEGFSGYSPSALRWLFGGRRVSPLLSFDAPSQDEAIVEAFLENRRHASISGVQGKVSLLLEKNQLRLTTEGEHGAYILKPIPSGLKRADQLPANEHLTMQIARQVYRLDVAPNALVFFQNGEPAYLTRRFDVRPDGSKRSMEDFASLAGKTEKNDGPYFKYDYSYEEIGDLIRKHLPAWQIEIRKYFQLVVFNYLFSNGDAHLKNFAILETDLGDQRLAPAYDLLDTRLHISDTPLALRLLRGQDGTGDPRLQDWFEFGRRLGIAEKRIEKLFQPFQKKQEGVYQLLERSFLDRSAKNGFEIHYNTRINLLNP